MSATHLAERFNAPLNTITYHLGILANQNVLPAFKADTPIALLHLKKCDRSDQLLLAAREAEDLQNQ